MSRNRFEKIEFEKNPGEPAGKTTGGKPFFSKFLGFNRKIERAPRDWESEKVEVELDPESLTHAKETAKREKLERQIEAQRRIQRASQLELAKMHEEGDTREAYRNADLLALKLKIWWNLLGGSAKIIIGIIGIIGLVRLLNSGQKLVLSVLLYPVFLAAIAIVARHLGQRATRYQEGLKQRVLTPDRMSPDEYDWAALRINVLYLAINLLNSVYYASAILLVLVAMGLYASESLLPLVYMGFFLAGIIFVFLTAITRNKRLREDLSR